MLTFVFMTITVRNSPSYTDKNCFLVGKKKLSLKTLICVGIYRGNAFRDEIAPINPRQLNPVNKKFTANTFKRHDPIPTLFS